METLRFVDLFAGIGGFNAALSSLGHECIYASEIDPGLRKVYAENFPGMKGRVYGDIRQHWDEIDQHFDVLCAGFPCQPFSKSGAQEGIKDETRGTLFHDIIRILKRWEPDYVILENVGNFERHDGGNTWHVVKRRLRESGYQVEGTEHVTPPSIYDWRDRAGNRSKPIENARKEGKRGGIGLISPHHFGHPHHRERFFVVASRNELPEPPFPKGDRKRETTIDDIVQSRSELGAEDREETALTSQQRACIDHWNSLVRAVPTEDPLPTFPIWGDEIGARYPFEGASPWATRPIELGWSVGRGSFPPYTRRTELLQRLPSYAREPIAEFRAWKKHYIRANREWWTEVRRYIPEGWVAGLQRFPPSLRKLEWNANSGTRNLWNYVLQFRPSGLRVKRYSSSPALVAMTATQIPILGPEKRFLTRIEGLRLQGFDDEFTLPESRTESFKALGNAVHVTVARKIATTLMAS